MTPASAARRVEGHHPPPQALQAVEQEVHRRVPDHRHRVRVGQQEQRRPTPPGVHGQAICAALLQQPAGSEACARRRRQSGARDVGQRIQAVEAPHDEVLGGVGQPHRDAAQEGDGPPDSAPGGAPPAGRSGSRPRPPPGPAGWRGDARSRRPRTRRAGRTASPGAPAPSPTPAPRSARSWSGWRRVGRGRPGCRMAPAPSAARRSTPPRRASSPRRRRWPARRACPPTSRR